MELDPPSLPRLIIWFETLSMIETDIANFATWYQMGQLVKSNLYFPKSSLGNRWKYIHLWFDHRAAPPFSLSFLFSFSFFSLFLFPFTGSLPPSLFPSLFQSQLTSLSSAGASQAKCWDEGGERICTSGGARSYPANILVVAIQLSCSLLHMKGVLMNVLKDFSTNHSICSPRYHVKN